MFICNFKINSNFILKLFLTVLLIIVLSIIGISVLKLFNGSSDNPSNSNVYNLTPSNYTNVLKAVHSNIDNYVGQQICFSGYVYRVYDFDDTQFVLETIMGFMVVKGSELELVKLDTLQGNVSIKGMVDSITYADENSKKDKEDSIFNRLFK